jgi:hypothetical protein
MTKESEAGPSKKAKNITKKAKKSSKDAQVPDSEAGPSRGVKN